MLQAGKVERVLVFGILVIIGLILVVAIRGAQDVEKEFENQVTALDRDSGKQVPEEPPAETPRLRNNVRENVPDGLREALDQSTNRWERNPGARTAERRNAPGPESPMRRNGTQGMRPPGPKVEGSEGRGLANPIGLGGSQRNAPHNRADLSDPDGPIVFQPRNQLTESRKPADDPGPGSRNAGGNPAVVTPAPAATPAAVQMTYVVQKGDTLEGIANRLYGKRSMWRKIMDANPKVSDPTKIRPDMELLLPGAPKEEARGLVQVLGAPAESSSASSVTPRRDSPVRTASNSTSGKYQRITSVETHKVQAGDTLMNIAQAAYGTKAAWRLIFDSNTDVLKDKNQIRIGQVLKLPRSGP